MICRFKEVIILIKSKYKAVKTIVDGITFDSIKEAKRYKELKLLERAGMIEELQLQVPFVLFSKSKYGRVVKYIADFTYYELLSGNKRKYIVEDVKGMKTPVYKLKKRIMAECYGIVIKEV